MLKWKTTLLLVLLSLPGVAAMSWFALPLLAPASASHVPLETLQVAAAVQSTVLVALAAVAGASTAPRVGVSAPVVCALAAGGNVLRALRPQIAPGIAGGMIGAAIIVAFHRFAPEALAAARPASPLPLAVRLLYGGITEEVLVRWGLMTTVAWAGWRIAARRSERPAVPIMWVAIVISALVFGLSHLPAATSVMHDMPASVAVYVTVGNALFGLVAGYLFWRRGLEAAIMAHGLAHLLAFMVQG